MTEQSGKRIQVVLRWIQILDKLEPFYKETGEFVFRSKVESANKVEEYRFPEEGYYAISDKPGWNRLEKLNKVLFDGVPGEGMVVELLGEDAAVDAALVTGPDHHEVAGAIHRDVGLDLIVRRCAVHGDCGWSDVPAPQP